MTPSHLWMTGKTSCICHFLHPPASGLSGWSTSLPRASRALSSEPIDLLEPQPLGICPKHLLLSLSLQVDFALAKGSAPLPFPSRKPDQAHDKFKKANGTRVHKSPWTRCPSLGFWLQPHSSSPGLLVLVLPIPSGVVFKYLGSSYNAPTGARRPPPRWVSAAGFHVAGLHGPSPLVQEYFSVLTLVGSYKWIFVPNLYLLVRRTIQQLP